MGVPLNVSIGQIGQIIGPFFSLTAELETLTLKVPLGVYIYKKAEAPGYPTGHYTNAGFCISGTVVVLILRTIYVRRNKVLGPDDKLWRL